VYGALRTHTHTHTQMVDTYRKRGKFGGLAAQNRDPLEALLAQVKTSKSDKKQVRPYTLVA
jgi:hypothetical protein